MKIRELLVDHADGVLDPGTLEIAVSLVPCMLDANKSSFGRYPTIKQPRANLGKSPDTVSARSGVD